MSKSEIVYLLTNPAMPGLIKIGRTTRKDIKARMRELYTTGVPLPFECLSAKVYRALVFILLVTAVTFAQEGRSNAEPVMRRMGLTLARTSSISFSALVSDNAFTTITKSLNTTVEDSYMAYGIYMTAERKVWAHAYSGDTPLYPLEPLSIAEDSMALWASTLTEADCKEITIDGISLVEFAVPVFDPYDDHILGHIRYCIFVDELVRK